ncbi:MAG: porin family protein [Paludibacteraceae bacterium]
MKAIKLSMVALATLLTFGFANAQDGLGVQAGFSTETVKPGDDSYSLKGFHVGPTYEMSIQGPISLQYGLLYNYLTHKETILTTDVTETKHVIDIPVRLAATFPVVSGIKAYVFGGPNFNIGLSDQISAKGVDEKYNLYKDNEYTGKYSRFDVQLGVGGGVKYNSFGIRASYDFGLLNRIKDADPAVTGNSLKIALTYDF